MNAADREWYIAHDGQKSGPYRGSDLGAQDVGPETLVWCKDMPAWAAAKATDLADLLFGTPPPLIVPSPPVNGGGFPPLLAHVTEPEVEQSQESANYLVRHWRGELSLARSYWMNVFGVSLLAMALLSLLPRADIPLRPLAAIILGSFLALGVITVWQVVGFYRSLREHMRSGESAAGTVWGWIGMVVLVIGTTKTVVVNLWPESVGEMQILRGDPELGQMHLELLPSGKEIELSGALPAGCSEEFRAFLEKTPAVKILQIDSYGGRIYEAHKIGAIVAARHMTTFVSGQCLSAATLVFLSGESRFAYVGAKIGFHAGSFPGMAAEDLAKENADVEKAVEADGVKKEFAERISRTPSSEMWYPTIAELLEAGVIQAPTHGERFGVSSATIRSFQTLEKQMLAIGAYSALNQVDPEAFKEICTALREAVMEGLSEGAVEARGRSVLMKKISGLFPYASDEALVDLLNFWIFLSERYIETHPMEACEIMLGQPASDQRNFLTVLPGYPLDMEMGVMTKVILTGGKKITRPVDEALVNEDLKIVGTTMNQTYPGCLQMVSDNKNYAAHPAETLRAYSAMLKTIRDDLSPSDQANLMRWMVSQQ